MGQLFPGDCDRFGGVFGLLESVSDNKANSISDMAHLVSCEDAVWGHIELGVWQLNSAGQNTEIRNVARGDYKAHTWHRPRLGAIDLKPRMRVRRPHHKSMQRLARLKISNIPAQAAQQRIVFHTED
jgi:hypothetical protein